MRRQKDRRRQLGVAAGAAAAVRISFAGTFCAAGLLEASLNGTREEQAVTIPPDAEAQILRYHHVEKWRIGTIARQLHLHYDTVARVLAQAGLPRHGQPPRPSKADPYLPFIRQTLEKFPTLTASRRHAMVCERGYSGSPGHFRSIVARHRPRPAAEAYLRLRTLPGEQAQVDWAHFGHIAIGRARRPLMAFVMVLSWSRMVYLHFFLNARMENFLRGHAGAFAAWGGVPRVLLYDNLKSAVLERRGEAIRFNPALIDFARHYRFEPRPVAVARGNEKGRVERAIRSVRDNFFAARRFDGLDDLNAQAQDWRLGAAAARLCPEDRAITVREAFAQEAPKLMASPEEPYAPKSKPARRPMSGSMETTTPSLTLTRAKRSPCSPTFTTCASPTSKISSPATRAATIRAPRSRTPHTSRRLSNKSAPLAGSGPRTGSSRPFPPAATSWSAPRRATRISVLSPRP